MPKTAPADDLIDRLLAEWKLERPDLDASAMAIVGRVIHLGRRFEIGASKALATYGLHYTDLDVLATLRRSGKPHRLSPGRLQASVLLTSGAMTACLRRLEQAGLIVRVPDAGDRRSICAELTAAGRRLVDKAIAARFEEAHRRVAGLNAAERRQLASLLRRLGQGREDD